MSTLLYYREQEARERRAAEQTKLENVRDRCQRSAEAWGSLAARLERADQMRAQLASDKQERG